MEKFIKIPTNDGHLIDGALNGKTAKNNKLIIFMHGLSDHKDHRLVFNASKFFARKGFHTFRFSLYSDEPKCRILDDCSISTFKEDIDSVIYYFQDQYKEIYFACHSLGFVVLDCDLTPIKKIALWDPSLSLKVDRIESLKYEPALDAYFINWGVSFIISKQLKTEWENINDKRLLEHLKNPLAVFMADKSDLKVGWKENLKYLKTDYIYKVIKGSSHGFVEEGKEEELFGETLKFFKEK